MADNNPSPNHMSGSGHAHKSVKPRPLYTKPSHLSSSGHTHTAVGGDQIDGGAATVGTPIEKNYDKAPYGING